MNACNIATLRGQIRNGNCATYRLVPLTTRYHITFDFDPIPVYNKKRMARFLRFICACDVKINRIRQESKLGINRAETQKKKSYLK